MGSRRPHITQNWRGRPLTSREVVVNLIGNTRTRTGQEIHSALDESACQTAIKVTDAELAALRLKKDRFQGRGVELHHITKDLIRSSCFLTPPLGASMPQRKAGAWPHNFATAQPSAYESARAPEAGWPSVRLGATCGTPSRPVPSPGPRKRSGAGHGPPGHRQVLRTRHRASRSASFVSSAQAAARDRQTGAQYGFSRTLDDR
jgi:hypothetical protein